MDVAKGAAVVAVHEEGMRPLLGRNLLRRNGVPTILIPTTAGGGTEVTQAVVVYVPEEGAKKSIWDPRTMAEAAIVDPELTLQMPPRIDGRDGFGRPSACHRRLYLPACEPGEPDVYRGGHAPDWKVSCQGLQGWV